MAYYRLNTMDSVWRDLLGFTRRQIFLTVIQHMRQTKSPLRLNIMVFMWYKNVFRMNKLMRIEVKGCLCGFFAKMKGVRVDIYLHAYNGG